MWRDLLDWVIPHLVHLVHNLIRLNKIQKKLRYKEATESNLHASTSDMNEPGHQHFLLGCF